MNKLLGIIAGIIIIAGAVFVFTKNNSTGSPKLDNVQIQSDTETAPLDTVPVATTTEEKPVGTKLKAGEYTMADVGKHSGASSCWSAVNGGVYDLTKWIGSHPGGEGAILSICGKDGSSAFNDQHGGQQKQANVLASFKIGVLVN